MKDFPELSIVVPARDEEANLAPLVGEVEAMLGAAGIAAELIVVDDGSTDGTPAALAGLATGRPWLRSVRLPTTRGQSAALLEGIRAARGRFVAMLDADLQNDPADLVSLLELARGGEATLVQGVRAVRRDPFSKRLASWIGWQARRILLGDVTRDTGCTLRVLDAELARRLPLHLKGLHRFVPVYARALGARVAEVPVSHRPRTRGRTKYGLVDRGLSGLIDCLGVGWMLRRLRDPSSRGR